MSFKSQRRLSAQQFQATVPFLRISPDRIEAARRTMVNDESAEEVAKAYGWTRNAVSICVRKVWDVAEKLRQEGSSFSTTGGEVLPRGWEKRTFVAPASLMDKWTVELEALLSGGGGMPAAASAAEAPAAVVAQPAAKKAAKKAPAAKKSAKKK
jgi:TrfB plasmid transcriptional repressor